jgi:hypothetical protein
VTLVPSGHHAPSPGSDEHYIGLPFRPRRFIETMHSINIQGFTYEQRHRLLADLTLALANCGGWVLERKTLSPTNMEFRVEIQLLAVLDLYAANIGPWPLNSATSSPSAWRSASSTTSPSTPCWPPAPASPEEGWSYAMESIGAYCRFSQLSGKVSPAENVATAIAYDHG